MLREALAEERGAIHDGVLEPLALVDREQLHGVRVALEAELACLAAELLRELLVGPHQAEPAHERARREALAGGRAVKQLAEVEQVRHAALAVDEGKESLLGAQLGQHAAIRVDEAVVGPVSRPGAKRLGAPVPFALVRLEGEELVGGEAGDGRGEGGPHRPGARRLEDGVEEQLDVARLVGLEDALVAAQGGRDLELS